MERVNTIHIKKPGRRAGAGNQKEKILFTAQSLFAKRGYERTSLRQIAREAQIDPALIAHYFSNKQKLFIKSMLPLIEAPQVLPQALQGDRDEIGLRLATAYCNMMFNPTLRMYMLGIIRSAASDDQAALLMKSFISEKLIAALKEYLEGKDADLTANLIGSQVVGMFFAKYVIGIEPLASASQEEIVAILAPRLQSYFS